MTKEQYRQFHNEFCETMITVTGKKNADYSGSGGDPFANFRHIGGLVQGLEVDVVAFGFLTRMSDKMARIGSFITKGKLEVTDESVEDSLIDLANYSALLAGYLRERREAAKI